jgi:hypothetical protein
MADCGRIVANPSITFSATKCIVCCSSSYFRVAGAPTGIREVLLNALAKTHSYVDLKAMRG